MKYFWYCIVLNDTDEALFLTKMAEILSIFLSDTLKRGGIL